MPNATPARSLQRVHLLFRCAGGWGRLFFLLTFSLGEQRKSKKPGLETICQGIKIENIGHGNILAWAAEQSHPLMQALKISPKHGTLKPSLENFKVATKQKRKIQIRISQTFIPLIKPNKLEGINMDEQVPENTLQRASTFLKKWIFSLNRKYWLFAEKHPRRTRLLAWGAGLGIFSILLVVIFCTCVYLGAFGKLPTYAELKGIQNYNASQVFSQDSVLLGKYYVENRLNADFEEISPFVIQALVATEDARFFQHSGIDTRAAFRVLFKTVLMGDHAGGGSTLSQQLVKNVFQRQDFGIFSIPANKVKEMFVARRLEKLYTKEELLNLYLNTVPFSENIFGIKVAAQRFFNTSPKYLKAEQAAVLVGMLKATTSYNPVRYPVRSMERRNVVLEQMAKYQYLSSEQVDSLQKLDLNLYYQPEGANQGLATYLREQVRQDLKPILENLNKPDGTPYNLYTDGLRIFTTIDSRLQQYAEAAVHGQMQKLQKTFDQHWKGRQPWGNSQTLAFAMENSPRYQALKAKGMAKSAIDSIFRVPVNMTVFSWEKEAEEKIMSPLDSIKYYLSLLNAGFLAIDPHTGAVKAWVGGIHHRFFQYDHVKANRQAGSTFKPIVYASALEQGIPPCEYIDNLLTTYPEYDNWTPENSDGHYGGVYSMEGGLSNSVNTVTVDLLFKATKDSVRMLGKRMGIQAPIPDVPSIALGVAEVSLIDLVTVYGTLANKGTPARPYYISRIETSEGVVVLDMEKDRKKPGGPVLSQNTRLILTKMLQSVVDSGTAKRLRWEFGLTNPIAGKTGTTQNQSDGWFVGFTPELVAGVWVGGELPQIRFRSLSLGQGSSTALPIFGQFYQQVLKDPSFKKWKNSQFPALPDSLYKAMNCPFWLENRPPDWLFDEDTPDWLRDFIRIFKKESASDTINLAEEAPAIRREGTPSERSREIQRNNEQLEKKRTRQKKRKEFWDRVFGKE